MTKIHSINCPICERVMDCIAMIPTGMKRNKVRLYSLHYQCKNNPHHFIKFDISDDDNIIERLC